MTPSLQLCLAGFLLCLGSVRADTVVLSTGESIEGSLVSADEHTVRIRDARGIVEEIPRVRVTTIRFSTVMAPEKTAPANQPPPSSTVPEEQRQFCSLVTQFQREQMAYAQETNPIRKAGMLPPDPYRYEPQVRALFGTQHQFVKWTGRLRFATSGHSVQVVFTPACDPPQMIQFANAVEQPGFPGQDRATVIRADSPIARTLAHAQASDQPALVSGSLVPVSGLTRLNQALGGTPNNGQGRVLFRSSFSSVGASLAQPNYLVQFTSVVLPEESKKAAGEH